MKKLTQLVLVLLYLGLVLASLVIAIKPGASIFYSKKAISPQDMIHVEGQAYQFQLSISPLIYRSKDILLYEDGQPLSRMYGEKLVSSQPASYSLTDTPNHQLDIYFSSSDSSTPIENGKSYLLYLPWSFISRSLGIFYLVILSPLLIGFMYFSLIKHENRQVLFHSPKGVSIVIDRYFAAISGLLKTDGETIRQQFQNRARHWKQLFIIITMSVFIYVFMEWIFFVTMPSFMSIMSLREKLDILMLTGLALSLLSYAFLTGFIILDVICVALHLSWVTRYLGVLIPTLIISALGLLLVDNFTYTIFKFGIVTSSGIGRGIYGFLFVLLVIYVFIKLIGMLSMKGNPSAKQGTQNRWLAVSLGILIVSIILAFSQLDFRNVISSGTSTKSEQAASHPNIILLGSDGISADHLSVYGYTRDTSPMLSTLAKSSLVAENAFSNAGTTAGSIVSMMTSKLPIQTGVLFPPNILTGINSYQHLPGILKNEGYQTIEYGEPYFIDAYNYNFQNAFDMVNNRSEGNNRLSALSHKLGADTAVYFINKLISRISDRMMHIFFIKVMENPYEVVTHPITSISDEEKITQTLDLLDNSTSPMFIHVHLLGTHGPRYAPAVQLFSEGEQQDQDWMTDFYDDTILAFDRQVELFIEHLKASGQWDNTILIIYSDHSQSYRSEDRIPLIIHFPGDKYSGRLTSNVQNLDIAPTILDYLGLSIPAWMNGKSLLHGNLDHHRLIFAMMVTGIGSDEVSQPLLDPNLVKPPFYQFGYINIVDCQEWYVYNLIEYIWKSDQVPGYSSPCSDDSLLSNAQLKQAVVQLLQQNGFDTSSIP